MRSAGVLGIGQSEIMRIDQNFSILGLRSHICLSLRIVRRKVLGLEVILLVDEGKCQSQTSTVAPLTCALRTLA